MIKVISKSATVSYRYDLSGEHAHYEAVKVLFEKHKDESLISHLSLIGTCYTSTVICLSLVMVIIMNNSQRLINKQRDLKRKQDRQSKKFAQYQAITQTSKCST